MKIVKYPSRQEWGELLRRPVCDIMEMLETVRPIVERVRAEGDAAVKDYEARFDGVELDSLAVSAAAIDEGCAQVDDALKAAIDLAYDNITAFHGAQRFDPVRVEVCPGVVCEQRAVPIERVGLYVPGGTAPLFSTVLMLAAPARIAGCRQVVLCSPPGKDGRLNPAILYAARKCGVTQVFAVGGAQAIAAMASGTESIPKVDKIFGPGNQYVMAAKQLVSLYDTAIDLPAGPSEVLVMADRGASPEFVAADLLSQAEHGGDSRAMLVCDDRAFAQAVAQAVGEQAAMCSRGAIIRESLSGSGIVVLDDPDDRIDFAADYAPEHLILALRDPWPVAERIPTAGSVFIGDYSPESAGDYASGTNHTLPTGGWGRVYSGVNTESFMRRITYQELTRGGLEALSPTIVSMAEAEGLDAHARAVTIRLKGGVR